MKKITIFLAALLLVFAAGCREDASLDGLESQTKEEGTSAGENAESIAVKEALTYESALEYNWVAEYAPAAGKSYTILFNFLSDSSVATDSPVSETEKNLALFSVSALKEGGVIIKFDGPTMLNDEIVDSEFRERQLIVESKTETTINCVGASSGKPVVLTKATSEDVLKLGEKLVWLALSKKNAMQGVLRDSENKFLARYAVDKKSRSMEFTWIDAANKDAKHESAGFELEVTDAQYGIQWPAVTINGVGYSSLTYTIAGESLAFNVADAKITAVTEAHPGFVDKASKQYNLGGKLECGTAHPTLWSALVSDKFRSILFYPYADDIPLRVEVYVGDGTTGNYLFVNDYTTDPKTARFDSDADWIRFYASVQGDFLKIATGSEIASYPISQAAADLKPFTDFYFHADGLYVIEESDSRGKGFYLISKTGNLWVKVRDGLYSEGGGEEPGGENFLPQLVAQGMKPYGTFFDNDNKNFKLHYSLDAEAGTADLIWIEDSEAVYTDGNYREMARNKAQYKTVAVDATEAGVITFREPLTVGSVTYKGLTWTGPYTPNVDGLSCTIRTPLQSEAHPLEYFFTYPVNKYEGGTPVFIPYSRLCLPTVEDDIPGMTGTERYIFYPYTQPGGGTPAGPCAIEVFAVGKGQRIDIKSFRNGFENHPVSIAVSAYKVEDDRMIFTKGDVTGAFVDADGNEMSSEESQKLVKPLERLLFGERGFHVYKAESVSYDGNKHYFYLVSPDPSYPYWIKIREA